MTSSVAQALRFVRLRSVVDWPLGTLTYGNNWKKNEKELDSMKNEKGFSLIELLIVVAIIGIIAAIAIPNLLKSRQAANEASGISAVRTVGTAQATFQSTKGLGKDFALTLGDLATEGSVDPILGGGAKSGYSFSTAGTASTSTVPSYFDTKGDPLSSGTFGTGNRSFYSNETYVIYQQPSTGTAIATPTFPARVPASPAQALQ